MHELSIAQALVEQVERIRERERGGDVVSVTVNVGALSGVERAAFAFAFPIAVEGTALAGAKLVILETPAEVTCDACGRCGPCDPTDVCCGGCGSRRVRVTAGRDMLIQAIEMKGA